MLRVLVSDSSLAACNYLAMATLDTFCFCHTVAKFSIDRWQNVQTLDCMHSGRPLGHFCALLATLFSLPHCCLSLSCAQRLIDDRDPPTITVQLSVMIYVATSRPGSCIR